MGKRLGSVLVSGLMVAFLSGMAMAQHGSHGHGGTSPAAPGMGSHEMPMMSRAARSVAVEGYKITFDVMDMSMHMAMPGMKGSPMHGAGPSKSHAIMVTVQDTASKEIISDAKVMYTILSPSGKNEMGKLEWSGEHYGGSFSPKEKGTYQVQLTIESGGMEREAKFTYEVK